MKWILIAAILYGTGPARGAAANAEDGSEVDTVGASHGTAGDQIIPTLNLKARFDAAFSGGEPTQQGFSLPHFFLGVDGTANPYMTYRLTVSPSREYSTGLVPNIVPTEAFVRLSNVTEKELNDGPSFTASLGLMAPMINPWWSPDIGELWVPDFFYGQRLLLLGRDMGVEFGATLIPKRLELRAGYFNGNGIFGFNTNNSRAITGFGRLHLIPPGEWRIYVGGGGFHFGQGSTGSSNFRSQWVANPFLGIESDLLKFLFTLEGWFGGYQDVSRSCSPKGVVLSLRAGHERMQGFVRYLNLSSVPNVRGYLEELQLGITTDPFPNLKMFLFYQQVKGRSNGPENSVNLRARFSL